MPSVEQLDPDDQHRLGWLVAVVDALARGDTPPDWVEPEPDDIFGELRTAIREIGPSRVAERAGVNPTVITRYLSGERDVRGATLSKLLVAAGFAICRVK
jgi:DNA-binding phage protein